MTSDVEARTQAIGRELLEEARGGGTSPLERWMARVFEKTLEHDAARLQLFRFVDVLPSLASDADVVRHLQEYFDRIGGAEGFAFPGLTRLALRVSRAGAVGEHVVAGVLRETVRRLARRFIVGATPEEALRAARAARRRGEGFTLDVLGEACLTDEEADAYQRRYLELVQHLGGAVADANISVKLSALDPLLDPIDPEGSALRVGARLRPILRAAAERGVHIQVDMEDHRLKDLTLEIVTALFDEPEFRGRRAVGVVVQAYLRESEADAHRLIVWARRRGTPVSVRLVKGAYWDYETAHARLEGWPVPVWEAKSETDASFEGLTRVFLEAPDAIDLAVGSHNVRSIAHALAVRETLILPRERLELQMLYGMAPALAHALVRRGERVRIYMPFGELIPGMAYLVRRLLENTSNESFLLRGFVRGESPDVLLASPTEHVGAAGPLARAPSSALETSTTREGVDGAPTRSSAGAPPSGAPATGAAGLGEFANEPHADVSVAANRRAFADALVGVRDAFGRYHPLVIGGERVRTEASIVSVSPSRAADVVGTTASASETDVDRAVEAARRAFRAWSGTPVRTRADILGRAAELLRQRRWAIAALIVHEAGKPWREADGDVSEAVDFLEYYRRQALALMPPQRLGHLRGEINTYEREPRGVAAVIAPWNFPLAILTGMTSAALVTGNTVVMKPAEQTPVIAARLVTLLEEAGVPPGVVNYVPGEGAVAGARLVQHPDVALIAFTGSQDVGTRIYAEAARHVTGARRLKRVVAEMGGKNAIVVDDDADLDEAVQGIVTSAFGYAGQKCSACSRVIAVGSVYPRLVDRVVASVRTLPMGPADAPGTVIGPVIDAASQEKIAGYIDVGKRIARPVLIRDVDPRLAALGGTYVAPAVFADVPPTCVLARDEIFGPVLSMMSAASFDEALALALDSDYALTGGVFSRSPRHLASARDGFRVGNLYLNRGTTGARVGRQPFGGRQLSGIGYQAGGPDYLIQFVETRVVSENTLRRGFASDELA